MRPEETSKALSKLQLSPNEVPKYVFCESVFASGASRWHIRKVRDMLKPSGGIDSPSLCGLVTPEKGGWDLRVRISEHHLDHACPACVREYVRATERV